MKFDKKLQIGSFKEIGVRRYCRAVWAVLDRPVRFLSPRAVVQFYLRGSVFARTERQNEVTIVIGDARGSAGVRTRIN